MPSTLTAAGLMKLGPRVARLGVRTSWIVTEATGRAAGRRLAVALEPSYVALLDAAVRTAIRRRLVEHAFDELFASGAMERIADRLLAGPLPERVAELLLRDGVAERVADRMLSDPEAERLLVAALDSPRAAMLAERVLESDGMERLVAQVVDSRLMDAGVVRLLEGDDLWLLIAEIVRSPVVTEAIERQGLGLADEVADEMGKRSRSADARLERAARRLLRRPSPPPADATGVLAGGGPP